MLDLMGPVEEFLPPRPRLRLGPILRFQRYRRMEEVAPPILEIAHDMVGLAEKLVEPRVVFVRRAIEAVGGDGLRLRDGPTFHGHCLGRHLVGAREAVCLVATVGPRLDARVEELAGAQELLEALFLDTAGWLAVEDALRAFRDHLRGLLRPRGFRPSPRLGPGYLDWSLWEQADLFSLFAGSPMPVAVSEYCVMTPRKSLTALFGLVPLDGGPRRG